MDPSVSLAESYGWLSLLPPLMTIILALWTKRVVESLFIGIAACAWVIDFSTHGMLHSFLYAIPNIFTTLAGHPTTEALQGIGLSKDPGRSQLIIFIILLGSFITVLDYGGGALDFAKRATNLIKTKTEALLVTAVLGFSIFTSAYFCILVTGTVMRPICDRLKISREKLAFYCDATSAPSKAWLPISGWIAFMVTLITENIPAEPGASGITMFIKTMPYNYYCLLTPVFIFLLSMRWIPDFGPMKAAEIRVESGVLHKPGTKPMVSEDDEAIQAKLRKNGHVLDMAIPLLVSVVAMLVLGMWNAVSEQFSLGWPKIGMGTITVLNVSFFLGIMTALVQYVGKGLMKAKEFLDHVIDGGKSAVIGAMIIMMAITLGDLLKALPPEGLGTARFIVEITESFIVPSLLPAMVFLIASMMSFATGSSWGTWAIMMPIGIPIALTAGVDPFVTTAAILSGGAFGDQCSPISDTTILSSLSGNVDHLQHVRTQVPYAVAVGAVALVAYLITGFVML